ncbi:inner nuclear membrane protein Man1 [Anoplophora glabripennis]|uniref:inner nuclear membrane protein Man1 n=1 Tax=Anoplophora glabripennis TaxID=217634 RepID=UPI000875600D|nr:inner nuclear membrane protein Man1 [Anoplophora glabripennis]
MVDVDKLSDAELRTKLLEFGFPVMPITGTTRKVMSKKLKMLLENKNKIGSDGGRKSLGRYSSEEDSDTELKVTKKKDNRRATMAVPIMQPPSVTTRRKSTRLNDTEVEDSHSPRREIKTTTSSTTTRTHKILKSAQDEFDTGSDSESDILTNSYNKGNDLDYKRSSPIKSALTSSYASSTANRYSPLKPIDASYSSSRNISFSTANASPSRLTSYNSPSLASEYASDRLNQIRSRLSLNSSGYDKPLYSTSPAPEKEETPFLSNFTKRLSAMTSQKNDYDYKNDIIKEHDTNGSGYVRSQLSSYRAARGRDTTYDYKSNQNSILKNNFVSFAVLAGAALFFIFLAIMYLGMRSDTSVIPAGINIPRCDSTDITSKKGINCVFEDDVVTAIHLLNVVKPELQKRAIANRCFDMKLKAHMTEPEIVTFCKTNFGIKDEHQIRTDLRNLEILSFYNPDWNINVAQTENNNGLVSESDIAENMEKVVFNYRTKITSLVMLRPDLPWRCRFYNTFSIVFNSLLFIGVTFGLLYLLNLGFKYYKHHEQKQKDEIGFMVEKIIDILQTNASEDGGENYVVINHVRDMILPVKDRQGKERTWAKAVKYINENESRVRTEIQEVQGEPFEVWRWIGSANLSISGSPRNKSWQGQAFETQVGSVNSLPCSPTPCLKIRGMVEDGDRNTHIIREAVLSKCAHHCRILHCAVDTSSNCVYIKCADPKDAAVAYRNLHGWWYAGHLVTVKYLRLERYMQRFPDSPVSGPPFLKAITPATDWSS